MTSYAILEKAEQVERAAADAYRAGAAALQGLPQAALLLRLAEEEDQHATRVRLLAARYRHDARLFQNVQFKLVALDAELAHWSEVRREIEAGRYRGDAPRLLGRLAELEEQSAQSHAQVLAAAADPAVAEFFHKLAEQDRAHRELLGAG
jgi:rubrerythrin